MARTFFSVLLAVAITTQVVNGQSIATCFAEADCHGSVIAQNSTWSLCCNEPTQPRSFMAGNGQCHNCNELVVEFAQVEYTVSEGDPFLLLDIVKYGETDQIILFDIIIEENTATGGLDFGPFPDSTVSLRAVILSNETELAYGVQIREDSIVEDTEMFIASLELISNDAQVGLNVTTVSITDNDFVNISITVNVTEEESDRELTFQITKEGLAVRNVTIRAFTLSGSAQDPGDYVPLSDLIVFAPADSTQSVTVTIINDIIVEDQEEFQVVLVAAEGETGVMFLQNTSTVFIMDNDTLELEFGLGGYSATEAGGMASLVIEKIGVNERPVTVRFSTQNGTTADVGQDFTFTDEIITFQPEDSFLLASVAVSMDGILEYTEVFGCLLTVPSAETGVTLGRSSSTVSIIDSDFVVIGLNATEVSIGESDGKVTVTVQLLEGVLGRPVTIEVVVAEGLATRTEEMITGDFEGEELALIFDETTTVHTFSINVTDDMAFEGPEDFTLTLVTSDTGATLMPRMTQVSIVDDEDLVIEFDSAVYAVNETDDFLQVEILLGIDLERPVEVQLSTMDGTATAGLDYVATDLALNFTNATRRHLVQIGLLDDGFSEGVEDFTLQLMLRSPGLGADGLLAEAVVLVDEDERVRLEFDQPSYTVGEGDQFVALRILKDGATREDIQFGVMLSDDTAIGGRDYGTFPESTITLAAVILSNETELIFGVQIREDSIIERTEIFTATLLTTFGTVSRVVLGSLQETIVFIDDNDSVNITVTSENCTLTLTPENRTLTQENGTMTPDNCTIGESTAILVFDIMRDPDAILDRPVTVEFFTDSGTASDPRDFEHTSQVLVFNQSITSHRVHVNIFEDEVVEDTEIFFVVLAAPLNETGAAIVQNTSAIHIIDDDVLNVEFGQLEPSFSEGEGFAVLSVLKIGENERTVVINASTMDGSARESLDYNATTISIAFGPGDTIQSASVPLLEDSIVEDTEDFFVTLVIPAGEEGVNVTQNRTTARVSIQDNDNVVVEFVSAPMATVEEGNVSVLTVNKNGSNDRAVRVQVLTQDGTAIAGSDYTALLESLEFPPSDADQNISISVVTRDDSVLESDTETFLVKLEVRGSEEGVTIGTRATTTISILDNDVVTIGIENGNYTMEERDLRGPVCVVKNGSSDLSFNATMITEQFDRTVPNRALANLDFAVVVNTLMFLPGSTKVCGEVNVLEDNSQEEAEVFQVSLLAPERIEISRRTAKVTIQDTTSNTRVGFEQSEYSVDEDGVNAVVCIFKEGMQQENVSVVVQTVDSGSSSYEDTFNEFVFLLGPPDNQRSCINIPLNDNNVALESDVQFVVNLTLTSGMAAVVRPEATVTIRNDDVVTVEFVSSSYAANESDGTVTVCMTKDTNTSIDFSITIQPFEMSAQSPEDFDAAGRVVQFRREEPLVCTDIPVVADNATEGNESFVVRFVLPNITGIEAGLIRETVVTIVDISPPPQPPGAEIGFDPTSYSVDEDAGTVSIIVIANQPNLVNPVTYYTEDVTATGGGVDYNSVAQAPAQLLTFPPNQTTTSISIGIINDTLVEGLEQFRVHLQDAGNVENLNITQPTATVDIMDSDRTVVVVEFDPASYTVSESGGSVTLTIVKKGMIGRPIQVEFSTADGTAIAGSDYTSTTETVIFPANVNSATVTVPILDDNDFEGDERFFGMLRLSASQMGVRLGVDQADVTITDDDPVVVVEFDPASYTVSESGGSVTLTIVKRGMIGGPLQVEFSTADGTAIAPGDFQAQDRASITFEANETEKVVTVEIVEDTEPEQQLETFTAILSLPPSITGVEIGSPAEVTIVDNDGLLGNDTIVGDPLFTVPLFPTSRSNIRLMSNHQPHLCYEINGRADWYFNLVSDTCTSVNAHYTLANGTIGWNVISSIGVKAVNRDGSSCVHIRVDAKDNCMPVISEQGRPDTTSPYQSGGIYVRKIRQRVRISVPNCNNTNLVMWITCQEALGGYQMLHFVILRGINLHPTSHGLVGQFWNVPIDIELYRGQPPPSLTEDELYIITVNPPDSVSRSFIGDSYDVTWDVRDELCFYAGSNQGGPIREIEEPNDSVIEGSYEDYRVQGLFSTQFVYAQFDDSMCN